MIDSHSHIFDDEFKEDLEDVLNRAKENNVNKIVLVGYSHEGNKKALDLALKYPSFLYNTAGIHPDQTDFTTEEDIVKLEDFIKQNKVYAIGEIGLDYHYEPYDKEKQKWLFISQLELAKKYHLPVVIHSRDANQETYDILKQYHKDLKILMHCYSGSKELMEQYVKLGVYISLGGPITFKNSVTPKEVCRYVPLDKFLIETDSPYMAPVPMRGKRNESSFVKYVLEEASLLKGINVSELERITEENTIKFFNLN